jgi:membrane protease YdiL (CAAX protease family)
MSWQSGPALTFHGTDTNRSAVWRRGAWALAGFAACVALAWAWQQALGFPSQAWRGLAMWQLAWMLVAAPLLEEWVFRRGLHDALLAQPRLVQLRFIGGWLSLTNCVVALTFSAFHAFSQGGWAVGVLAPALLIGWVYERQRSLRECVLLHAGFNLAWISALWLRA